MADDSITKKVLIDVQIANDDAQAYIQALNGNVITLANSLKDLKVVTTNSETALGSYKDKLAQSKLTAQQNREEITRLNLVRRQEADTVNAAKKAITAANGSYKEAQQSLTKLGNTIKNTEGGFRSQDAAIKAQIADYNKLNSQLKAYDTQMGNHQRNVDNYVQALSGITATLDKLIPGFSQFQGILQGAAQGFSAMGTGAVEGEAAIEGIGVASGVFGVALTAAVGTLASFIFYLEQLPSVGLKVEQAMSGIKGAAVAAVNTIYDGNNKDGIAGVVANAFQGYKEGSAATEAEQALQRKIEINEKIVAADDATIAENTRQLRSKKLTYEQAKQLAHDTKELDDKRLKEKQDVVDAERELSIQQATVGKNYKPDQKDVIGDLIRTGGLQAAQDLEYGPKSDAEKNAFKKLFGNDKDIVNKGTTENIQNVDLGTIANQRESTTNKINVDNRQAILDERFGKKQVATDTDLIDSQKALAQADEERRQSIANTLKFQMDAFSKELDAVDEHYRQLTFKQKEFIKTQEAARDKSKSPQAKANYTAAIDEANGNIAGYDDQASTEKAKIIKDNFDKQAQTIAEYNNQVKEAQDKNIQDQQAREIALMDDQNAVRLTALKKDGDDRQKETDQINAELANKDNHFSDETKKGLNERLAFLKSENDAAHAKGLADEEAYLKAKADLTKKYADQAINDQLEANVLMAKNDLDNHPTKKNNDAYIEAEQAKLDAAHNESLQELIDHKITAEQFAIIDQKYISDSDKLKADSRKKNAELELAIMNTVASNGFEIIKQSIAHDEQAQEVSLGKQKNYDLQNQALTTTQRYEIEEQYRVKEGQAKVKAFRANQKAAIAEALINGALAMTKVAAQTGVLSFTFDPIVALETAAAIGKIAAESPPAYARGGIHYDSDGKGGVLPGYSKVDNMNARLRQGEAVVVSEAMRVPWARQVVSAINQSFGGRPFDNNVSTGWKVPGFASGGIYNSYMPTGDNGLRPQINVSGNTRMHPDDISGIVNGLSDAIKMLPPPVSDIKDINFQQGRLSQAYDRANW